MGFLGPHLFLGNQQVARDTEWLRQNGIGWLLRCVSAWEVPEAGPPPPEMVEYELLLTHRGEGRMLCQLLNLQRVVEQEFLRHLLRPPHNLLVWCTDGLREGAAAIACILAQLDQPKAQPKDSLNADQVMAGVASLRTGARCQAQPGSGQPKNKCRSYWSHPCERIGGTSRKRSKRIRVPEVPGARPGAGATDGGAGAVLGVLHPHRASVLSGPAPNCHKNRQVPQADWRSESREGVNNTGAA